MACIYKTVKEGFFKIEVYLDSLMVILTPNHTFPNVYVDYFGIG